MNKQGKLINNKVVGGIEWTKTILPDGTEYQGYTHNPIAGCLHGRQWTIGDKIANCYAEDQAEKGQASIHYPQGFEHHYWHPNRLEEPLQVKKPARIFVGSMADVFGHWVDASQINQVLDICRRAHWHTFIFLTKNPVRMQHFEFPNNCWVGISSPPDFMWGKPLDAGKQHSWLRRSLRELAKAEAHVKWMSIEPLSFDIMPILDDCVMEIGLLPLDWCVIGAASNGSVYYQPDPEHLRCLIAYLDDYGVPLFYKGNLKPSLGIAFDTWRECYPPLEGRLF
jgi:protein gp37